MIWLLLYIIPCVLLAKRDANKIKNGKKIKHFWNGIIHFAISIIAAFLLKDWKAVPAIWLLAKLSFDVSLNHFRGLSLDYISPEVIAYKSLGEAYKKGKITDYIEWRLFRSSALPKIIYAFIIVILIVI